MKIFKLLFVLSASIAISTAILGSVSKVMAEEDSCPSCACYIPKELSKAADKDRADAKKGLTSAASFNRAAASPRIKVTTQVNSAARAVFTLEKQLVSEKRVCDNITAKSKENLQDKRTKCDGIIGNVTQYLGGGMAKCNAAKKKGALLNAQTKGCDERLSDLNDSYASFKSVLQEREDLAKKIQNLEVSAQTDAYVTIVGIAKKQLAEASAEYDASVARAVTAKNNYFSCIGKL